MKHKAVLLLSWISTCFGIFLALVTLILLFSGKASVAGVFVIPALALLLAGSNLRAIKK
jgi:hypothetical protein